MATNNSCGRPAAGLTAGLIGAGIVWAGTSLGAEVAPTDTVVTPAQWHTQKVVFSYVGFTAQYTCTGIEGKVKYILLAFGARKDLTVRASGCDRVDNLPSTIAWVDAEFSSLSPASDPGASDAVSGTWAKVEIAPNRPFDMGTGECELVEQMRDLLQKGFALRNTAYRTTCVPHHVTSADYRVNTEVLRLAAN